MGSPEGVPVPSTSCRNGDRGNPPIQGIGGFPESLNRRWFQIFTGGSPRGSFGSYHRPRGISSNSGEGIRGYRVRSSNRSRAGDPEFGSFLSRRRGSSRFRENPLVPFRDLWVSFRGTLPGDPVRRRVMIFNDRFPRSRGTGSIVRLGSPVRVVSNTAI